MANVTVTASRHIHRPIDVVQAQFKDFQHHIADHVHEGLEMTLHSSTERQWELTWEFKMMGRPRRDEVHVQEENDGSLHLVFTNGSRPAADLVVTFEGVDADTTRVDQVTTVLLRGLMVLARPLVKRQVLRDLEKKLEEDRIDLEENGYAR